MTKDLPIMDRSTDPALRCRTNRCRISICVLLGLAPTGCAQSVYDYPVPTMVGPTKGYSLTGYVATDSEDVVRERIAKNVGTVCSTGIDVVSLSTSRTDNSLGTKMLRYEAIVTCKR